MEHTRDVQVRAKGRRQWKILGMRYIIDLIMNLIFVS